MTTKPVPRRKPKPRPVVGSIKRREIKRANGSSYVVFRARLVDPDNRDARMERTFSEQSHGGKVKAKLAAEKWLVEQRDALSAGAWHDPRKPEPVDPGLLTVARVADEWAATWPKKLGDKTAAGYRHILDTRVLPYWGGRIVGDISARDVREWVDVLEETPVRPPRGAKPPKRPATLNARTIRNVYAVLRSLLRYAVLNDYIALNPCSAETVELPRRPKGAKSASVALSWQELAALVDAMPEHFQLPVELTVLTGLRAAECWGLCRRDWNPEDGTITIRQTLSDISGKLVAAPPKTEASAASLSVPEALHAALSASAAAPGKRLKSVRATSTRGNWLGYPAILEDAKGKPVLGYVDDPEDGRRLLFTTPYGRPVQHSNFYRRIYRPAVQALWPEGHRLHGARFHDLRHSAATNAPSQSPHEVMRRLRHSDLRMTGHYANHQDAEQDRLLAGRIDDAWRAVREPGRHLKVA